jgi:hypothetical protein
MMSLNRLKSYGWARDFVKSGDVISCTGARPGAERAHHAGFNDEAGRRSHDQVLRSSELLPT